MTIMNITSPKVLIFYGETEADLALMPTTTKDGEGKYVCGRAPKGSIARILTVDGLKVYMLRSTGWVDVTNSQIMEIMI